MCDAEAPAQSPFCDGPGHLPALCGGDTAPGLAPPYSHGAGRITEEFGLEGTFEDHPVQAPCCCSSALRVLWLLLSDQQTTEFVLWQVCVGRDLKDHLAVTPLGIFHYSRLLTALSNLPLNASRGGASTASPGNLLLHPNKLEVNRHIICVLQYIKQYCNTTATYSSSMGVESACSHQCGLSKHGTRWIWEWLPILLWPCADGMQTSPKACSPVAAIAASSVWQRLWNLFCVSSVGF